MKRRKYYIRLPLCGLEWVTTNSLKAMEFTHSFGTIGFNLFSKVEQTEEIDFILAV